MRPPTGVMSTVVTYEGREASDAPQLAKRIIIGDPLTSQQVDEQLSGRVLRRP